MPKCVAWGWTVPFTSSNCWLKPACAVKMAAQTKSSYLATFVGGRHVHAHIKSLSLGCVLAQISSFKSKDTPVETNWSILSHLLNGWHRSISLKGHRCFAGRTPCQNVKACLLGQKDGKLLTYVPWQPHLPLAADIKMVQKVWGQSQSARKASVN